MALPTDLRTLLIALRALAEPVATRLDLEVVAIELIGAAGVGGRVLRISLDKPGGSTITDCTRFSRIFSPALDAADLIASTYNLEVSTPGMDRPVQRLADFERFVGCLIRLKTWDMDSRRRLKAVILGVSGDEIVLDVDGTERRYHIDDVERANLVLDLDQYARLGEGLHPIAPPEPPPAVEGGMKPPKSRKPRIKENP